MDEREQIQRDKVIAIAREWLGTPYQARQCARGRGCDCGSLLLGIFTEAGLVTKKHSLDYDWLAPWARRGGDALYVGSILEHCREIKPEEVKPGDVALYHIGRGWSHAALVIEWPSIVIHAIRSGGVVQSTGSTGPLAGRERRFFSPRGYEC